MVAWTARALEAVDEHVDEMTALLSDLVRTPGITGTDTENSLQEQLWIHLERTGLLVGYWQLPLAETMAAPGLPGIEVPRSEAWGLVGQLPGRSDGPTSSRRSGPSRR